MDLLVDVMPLEDRQAALCCSVVVLDPIGELGVERRHVPLDLVVEALVVDDDAAVVGVELFADHPHRQLGFTVEQGRPLRLRRLLGDLLPLLQQDGHVGHEFLFGGRLGGRAHDEAVLVGLHPVEDAAQALADVVGEALRDPVGLRVRDEHHEPTGERHLLGETRTLVGDRILRHLTDDQLLVLQDVFDARVLAAFVDVLGVVLHVAAVEHGVLRRGDVDERGFHAWQDVLDATHVDVAVDLADVVGRATHVVLDQVATLEHTDLRHTRANLHGHEVAPDRLAVAFASPTLFEHRIIELPVVGAALAPPARSAALLRARLRCALTGSGRRRFDARGATVAGRLARATATPAAPLVAARLVAAHLGAGGTGHTRRTGRGRRRDRHRVTDPGLSYEGLLGSFDRRPTLAHRLRKFDVVAIVVVG